jgi:UDP-galactopyranose mutase
MPEATQPALLCLSHLRWDFVYQRPNHLMVRAAKNRRVYFVEEPVLGEGPARLDLSRRDGVVVVQPQLPADLSGPTRDAVLGRLVADFVRTHELGRPWLWYYTPMALPWTRRIDASAVIYDCMDELSAFRGAPRELVALERELFSRADVVFTGGRSLYEAKTGQHPNVHAVPSAVEVAHFAGARREGADPADQAAIPRPRIGYYGVIDERLDLQLIADTARLRPDWHIVLVGPVAKLAPEEVPAAANIHRLGLKGYDELPDYLRGWDVAMMPFALNEATRYISPTKTPEYLAGGRPVVSTPVRDVVEPYGRLELVHIADTAETFVQAIERALREDVPSLLRRADGLLAEMSWDATWARMDGLVRSALAERTPAREPALELPMPALQPATLGVPSGRTAYPGGYRTAATSSTTSSATRAAARAGGSAGTAARAR